MIRPLMTMAALALTLSPVSVHAADPAPQPAKAFFKNIKDGDTVHNPVHLEFDLTGMKVAPAGTMTPGTGHFHLLIDTQLTDAQKKLPIPNDTQHMHFGKGQTEATITLPPGEHTLQLVMGDGLHRLNNPPVMSDIIHVTAEK